MIFLAATSFSYSCCADLTAADQASCCGHFDEALARALKAGGFDQKAQKLTKQTHILVNIG